MTTLRRVTRPRGELTPTQRRNIDRAAQKRDDATNAYQATVVQTLADGASFAEVRKHTGLSTSTLQKWKKEAQ